MLNRHLVVRTFLVAVLGLILLVSSCSPQREAITIPSPESGGQITSEPAVKKSATDLSHLIWNNPADVDNSNLPITPTEEIHITGSAPEVDIAQYRLTIDGLVNTELTLTYDMLLTYPTVTNVALLICPGAFADNAEWTGVPLSTLLAEAGIKPEASQLAIYALDGYRMILPLEGIQRDGVFLAHTVNGEILPREHGFPLRLVVTGKVGSAWVKWIEHIEVS